VTISPGLVATVAVIGWGVATHIALYGWQPAPVGSVRLSRRQWLTYVAMILPLLVVIGALVLFRGALLDRFGEQMVQGVLVTSILAIVASIWGLSPSMKHP